MGRPVSLPSVCGDASYKMGNLDEGITAPIYRRILETNPLATLSAKTAGRNSTVPAAVRPTMYGIRQPQGIYKEGCDIFRKRMECALMMQAAMDEEN